MLAPELEPSMETPSQAASPVKRFWTAAPVLMSSGHWMVRGIHSMVLANSQSATVCASLRSSTMYSPRSSS